MTKRTMLKHFIHHALVGVATLFALSNPSRADDLWDIYQIALTQDATYHAAKHEYERAKLNSPLAWSALRPSLSAKWSDQQQSIKDENDKTTDGDDVQVNVNADWLLYDHAAFRSIKQAKLQVTRAKILFDQTEDDLILRVADRYFGLLAAMDRVEVAQQQKVTIQQQMRLASKRLAVGLGTRVDLFDAKARFQQAVADEIQANNVIDNAVQSLKQIIAAQPATLATLGEDTPLNHPNPDSVDAWITNALANNLALKAANLNLKILDQEVKKQREARLPKIGVNANQQQRDHSTLGETDTTSYGATVTWNLFLGNSIHLKTKQAALQRNASEQSTEALRRQIESDTTSAYLAVSSNISQVNALSEAIRAGSNALRAKKESFRAGVTTNIDVLDAQRDLSRSRSDYLSARYAFIISLLRLEQAVGDLDHTDLQRINEWLSDR